MAASDNISIYYNSLPERPSKTLSVVIFILAR